MKKRILTGDRPTGKLHLGHYVGSLANRIKLQDEYDCFFLVADLHALTTKTDTSQMQENAKDLVLDYLSVGIDPRKATIYLQSSVPEVTEIATIFSMLVPISRVQRVPTLKEQVKDLSIQNPSLGLLSYPVLQAADILMVKGELVPVGKDQTSHVEVTREISQKFNQLYGQVLPVPEALIGEVPTLPGIDGKTKMSKSLGNAIFLSDNSEIVREKVMNMYTDPTRIHSTDPGHVEGNPVFIFLDAFSVGRDKEQVVSYKERYREGKVGDIEVKRFLSEVLNKFLDPIREKRSKYEKESGLVEKILKEGSYKAREEAIKTLKEVKEAMGLLTV